MVGVDVVFAVADPTVPPASDLLSAMVAELDLLYEGTAERSVRPVDPLDLAPPDGCYLVGRHEGRVVAGGGLRRFDRSIVEVKRMYVVPELRGRALAAALLDALEEEARAAGYHRARLDTWPLQPHAQHLYERHGYRSIPDYNGNPHASFWGEKVL